MYTWETLNVYCQQDPRWFEPLARRTPDDTHLRVYRALMPSTWGLRRRGLWFIADPPGAIRPVQGWKLHVAVYAADSAAALRSALPVLRDAGVSFKFLLDPWSVATTNGKLWPRGSSGKFIVVYPVDEDRFREVAGALTDALRDFSGPYVLSDRRCPGSTAVYYRYGGFAGLPRLRADGVVDLMIETPDGGQHPDLRPPYWITPPWISTDPFGLPTDDSAEADSGNTLADGRFTIESAIRFSNRGGVYRAVDTHKGGRVVIKEARPHVGFGARRDARVQAVDVLVKEHRILEIFADVSYFVDPVELFQDWEHWFLAEELVDGVTLSQLSISANPLYTRQFTQDAFAAYYDRMRGLFGQLAAAIAVAHERGVVLGDLSWTNVLVDGEDHIRLIDLEGAVTEGVDPHVGLFTPGVSSPRLAETGVCEREDDYYALGAMMFGSIMLANSFVGFHPMALDRFLDELARDLGLPEELTGLVRDLTARSPAVSLTPEVVGKRIADVPVGDPLSWPPVAPLAVPAVEQIVDGRAEHLRAEIGRTVDGITRYIRQTASPERQDRLFPADLGVFETNPLSVAFGAAGVLHALHVLPGEVPAPLVAWLLTHDITSDAYPPGLYLGQAGVAWVLDELGHTDAALALMRQAGEHRLLWDRPDLLYGCAGYGLASLRLWHTTGSSELLERAVRVGAHLAGVAQHNDRGAHWRSPEDRVPLGHAYGGSGIALFLLYLHHATGDPKPLHLGRRALDFELAHARQVTDGLSAFPAYADDAADPVLREYWEQGTAGVVTTLVRYLVSDRDPELAGWLDRLLPDICRKYAVMPQLFHGLAGLGNAVLDVAELADRPDLVAEALRVAEGVLLFAVEREDGIAFPGEQALRETTDVATGSAGVGLFLHRVLRAGPGRRTNRAFVLDELLPARPPAGEDTR